MTVIQQEPHQDPETEATDLIIYLRFIYLTETSQNVSLY